MVQRLAQQLGVENKGLTLVAKKGQRVQFGCSQRIRHTLSPDNSTLTFASKGDLAHHWLCCLLLDLERDWTWDGLADRSLVIERTKRFKEDDEATETETLEVGDIEIKRTAPFTALLDPDRSHTTLIFIDAVETKNERMQPAPHATEPRFPDLIEVRVHHQARVQEPGGRTYRRRLCFAARIAHHHAAGADPEDRFRGDCAVALRGQGQLLRNRAAPAIPVDRVRRARARFEGHVLRARTQQRARSVDQQQQSRVAGHTRRAVASHRSRTHSRHHLQPVKR